jgi:hypothetical protein
MLPDALDQYRQPEYTGENRCIPCTAVNVAIAVVLSMLVSFVGTPVLGLLALGGSLLAIYLRGYLVPGTPELTKQYFPDWLLAMFDKAEAPPIETEPTLPDQTEEEADEAADDADDEADDDRDYEAADPEELLFEMDAVQETEDGEDIELTDEFADDLYAAADDLRDDADGRTEAIAGLLGVALEEAKIHEEVHGPALYADTDRLHRWPSDEALLADASAHRALAEREGWSDIPPQQRLGIARALRSFLPTCPSCGGEVGLTEDTVSSCCRDWDVFAIRCADCDAHYLELEPGEADEAPEQVAPESEGAQGVSGGFTR